MRRCGLWATRQDQEESWRLYSQQTYTLHTRGPASLLRGLLRPPAGSPKGQSGCRGVSPDVHCLPARLSHAKAHQVLRAYRRGLGPSSAHGSEVSPAWP